MSSASLFQKTLRFGLLAWTACAGREDWGGPGPAPPSAPVAPVASADPATVKAVTSAAVKEKPPAAAAAGSPASAGDAGLTARVHGQLAGGKLPDWETTVTGMKPALVACVTGGEAGAGVEIVARIDPKGAVTGTDVTGGSQFPAGVVPCLVKKVEGAHFGKPTEGAPKVTISIKL